MNRNKGKRSNAPLAILLCMITVFFIVIVIVSAIKGSNGDGEKETAKRDGTAEPVTGQPVPDTTDGSGSVPGSDTETDADPVTSDGPVTSNEQDTTAADPETDKVTEAQVQELPGKVTYTNQVPLSEEVDDSYFDDALFIGDSRTVGFQISTTLNATYYAKVSLNISQFSKTDDFSRFITVNYNGQAITCNIYEALEYENSFGKVYICEGLSELGWDMNTFFSYYRNTLDYIRGKLPNAKIYIQTLVPVTAEYSLKELYGVTNERIWLYNQKLSELAEEYGIYLVNPAELFLTENNTLPPECSFDGMHLNGPQYREWLGYLKTHVAK